VSGAGVRRWARSIGRRQMYSLLSSLGSLISHRVGTVMTVLVLGIAMMLPIGLYVALNNLRAVDLKTGEWGSISVFLRGSASGEQVTGLTQKILDLGNASVVAVSPEEGMEEFRASSGFGTSLDVLESNPLPWVLLVEPETRSGEDLESTVQGLRSWLEKQEIVESIQLDYKWLQRLAGLLGLGNALVTILTVMFSLAVVVVIANTIRMDVANRAHEIEVLALVGAADGFIRQPFLYSGFWYGLLGSGLALILLRVCLFYLQAPLENLLDAYGNTFERKGLDWSGVGLVLLTGGLLGLLGAWVSVQRYLRVLRHGGLLDHL